MSEKSLMDMTVEELHETHLEEVGRINPVKPEENGRLESIGKLLGIGHSLLKQLNLCDDCGVRSRGNQWAKYCHETCTPRGRIPCDLPPLREHPPTIREMLEAAERRRTDLDLVERMNRMDPEELPTERDLIGPRAREYLAREYPETGKPEWWEAPAGRKKGSQARTVFEQTGADSLVVRTFPGTTPYGAAREAREWTREVLRDCGSLEDGGQVHADVIAVPTGGPLEGLYALGVISSRSGIFLKVPPRVPRHPQEQR